MTQTESKQESDDGTTAEGRDGPLADTSDAERRDWRQFARTWGNRIGLLLLVLAVVPFAVYAVPQTVGADHSYVVLSGSMEPAIGTGDAVLVDSVEPNNIETGDVITYGSSSDDRPTTHRVIGVNEGDGSLSFETKGDNNDDPDAGTVPAANVQGKVVSFGPLLSIPLIGYVINFTGTPIGFGALFVVPLVLLVLNEVWNVVSASSPASPESVSGQDDVDESLDDTTESDDESGDSVSDSGDGQLTFSASELELGLGVLVGFSAYSLWVAYATLEVWAFGVAGSTLVAMLLLGGIYVNGRLGSDSEANATHDDGDRDGTASSGVGSQASVSPEGDDD